jgi:HlyD family secretion protein
MWLPRPRFTIAHLMVLVVIAGFVLTGIVLRLERNRRAAALQVAAAKHQNAVLTREVAEIAVVEFTEGIYKQDVQTVDNEIALAKSDLERAFNQRGTDERVVEQARARLERAQQKKVRQETHTKDKTVKELKGEVARAVAAEQAAKAAYYQLKAAEAKSWW